MPIKQYTMSSGGYNIQQIKLCYAIGIACNLKRVFYCKNSNKNIREECFHMLASKVVDKSFDLFQAVDC